MLARLTILALGLTLGVTAVSLTQRWMPWLLNRAFTTDTR